MLSPREIQVLQLMADGISRKGIAARLHIKLGTVYFYVSHILTAMGAATIEQAVARAVLLGLVKPALKTTVMRGIVTLPEEICN
jgi:DNA-binding NarL/FixJ family response regulator